MDIRTRPEKVGQALQIISKRLKEENNGLTMKYNSAIDIILKDGDDGYLIIADFVSRYWSITKTDSPVIISFELSYDGTKYEPFREIAYIEDDDIEFFYDWWWGGQKYIRILGIESIDNIEVSGGIYAE